MSDSSANLVCVIDDDASIRKSLLRLLRSAGHTAEAFASARTFLDRPAHPGPSCLVVDVSMPEVNGLELQDALVAGHRDESVVFITGNGDIPMCARAMKAGAVDFLPKPFRGVDLLAAVNRALVRAGTQRESRAGRSEARARIATLTPRQLQVFQGVAAGKLNKEIAAELGAALKTIKIHRQLVMTKLGVVSVAELVKLAARAAD